MHMWCYGQYFLIFPKIVESFLIMWMVKNKVNKLTKLISSYTSHFIESKLELIMDYLLYRFLEFNLQKWYITMLWQKVRTTISDRTSWSAWCLVKINNHKVVRYMTMLLLFFLKNTFPLHHGINIICSIKIIFLVIIFSYSFMRQYNLLFSCVSFSVLLSQLLICH